MFPVVVDVGIDDEVSGRGEEGGPEGCTFPAVLEHYGDVGVGGFDQGDYLLDVVGHPCRAIVRKGGGLAQAGGIVDGFVYGGKGEGVGRGGGGYEVQDAADGVEG